MARSFQLFSDEISVTENQTLYLEYLAALQHYYKVKLTYPDTHKIVQNSLSGLQKQVDAIYTLAKCIVVVRIGHKIITQGAQLPSDDTRVRNLVSALERHRVRKIRFWRGYSARELAVLCELLGSKSADITRDGGLCFLLRQREVRNIEVIIASAQGAGVDLAEAEVPLPEELQFSQWMSGLVKAGIDQGDFLNYFKFNISENRLIQRELQLAAQAIFIAPHTIAELVLFMSSDPDHEDEIDVERIFLSLQRVENVMLMHSAYENRKIYAMLRSATDQFPLELRLEQLHFAIRKYRRYRRIYPGLRFFDFALPELFEVIMDEFSERGSLSGLDVLLPDRRKLMQLAAFCDSMLESEAGISSEDRQEFLKTLRDALRIRLHPGEDFVRNASAPPTFENVISRFRQLRPDLELGYLHLLCSLLSKCEPGTPRESDIADRLGSLLDLYLDKADCETLFPILLALSGFPRERHDFLRKRLFAKRLEELLKLFQTAAEQHPLQTAETLYSLQMFLPEDFLSNFMIRSLESDISKVRDCAFELCLRGGKIQPIVTGRHSRWSRVQRFNLLCASGDAAAEQILLDLLPKTWGVWRLCLIFMLARFSGAASREALLKQASKTARGHREYRRAAIHSLAERHEASAVPLLAGLIEKRNFCFLHRNYALRAAAAFALKTIGTERAKRCYDSSLDNFRRTWLRYEYDRAITWIARQYRRLVAWYQRVVERVKRRVAMVMNWLHRQRLRLVAWYRRILERLIFLEHRVQRKMCLWFRRRQLAMKARLSSFWLRCRVFLLQELHWPTYRFKRGGRF